MTLRKTPVSMMGNMDRMVWNHSKDGEYTTKSGYQMEKSEGDKGKMWKKVWSLNIKKKIQHFLWRAVHNQIPVESNLKKRGIQVEGICKQCGEGMETVEH